MRVLVLATLLALPARAADAPKPPGGPDVLEAAQAAGAYGLFLSLVQAAGMVDQLRASGPWTVLAPTDAALKALPAGVLDRLAKPEGKEELTRLIALHVVPARVTAAMLKGKQVALKTLAGPDLALDGKDGLKAAGVPVGGETLAANGVLDGVESVLPGAVGEMAK